MTPAWRTYNIEFLEAGAVVGMADLRPAFVWGFARKRLALAVPGLVSAEGVGITGGFAGPLDLCDVSAPVVGSLTERSRLRRLSFSLSRACKVAKARSCSRDACNKTTSLADKQASHVVNHTLTVLNCSSVFLRDFSALS